MFFAVIVLLVICIGMPIYYAWRIWRLDERSRAAWLIVLAEASVIVALVLLVGRWDMAGYYTRFLLLGLFLAAVLSSLKKHWPRRWRAPETKTVWRRHRANLISLALFGAVLLHAVSGILPPNEARVLAFPLQGGRFMVGHGGGIELLNHHADHPQQRYAADIVAIDEIGYRASGILPEKLEAYAIFGEAVVSPCAGEVVGARDGLPDLVPPQGDADNSPGNHVTIDCDGIRVELAHLQKGSVEVRPGRQISAGEGVGKVGNSGNTTEPHLHVHAVDRKTNQGVPMAFEGRVPVRNSLYVN
jgi:hypothetical protein